MNIIKTLLILSICFNSFAQERSLKQKEYELNRLQNEYSLNNTRIKQVNAKREELRKISKELREKSQIAHKEFQNFPRKKETLFEELKIELNQELENTKASLKEQIKITKDKNRRVYRRYLRCLKRLTESNIHYYSRSFDNCNKYKNRIDSRYLRKKDFINSANSKNSTLSIKNEALRDKWNEIRAQERKVNDEENALYKELRTLMEKQDGLSPIIEREKAVVEKLQFENKYAEFLSCNGLTPAIDLEQEKISKNIDIKGAFHNVPFDNQNGIGTCYANTGRNLLLGLSSGEVDASFLDMALQFKTTHDNGKLTTLDAGHTCLAINKVVENGYCPKKFSPIETGEDTYKANGIFGEKNSIYAQSRLLSLMEKFLNAKLGLDSASDSLSKKFLDKTKAMIELIKMNPEIQLPLPKVRDFPIKNDNQLRSIYIWSYEKNLPDGASAVPEHDFMNEYQETFSKFNLKYTQALRDGATPKMLRAVFDSSFNNFFTKYNMHKRMNDTYYGPLFKQFFENNLSQNDYFNSIEATLSFYEVILDKKIDEKQMREIFDSACNSQARQHSSFLENLKSLADVILQNDTDKSFFDEKGKLLSNREILQMMTTPNCLNEENRKDIPFKVSCERINKVLNGETKDNKELRLEVLKSLVKGLPVGNSYPTGPLTGHINTIVGFRCNPETNKVEYKIRESSGGFSKWEEEEDIFKKIRALTVVRKDND